MNPITRFFPEAMTHALGWTLLHSLWQGAFVALLLSLLLLVMHRQSAKTRYAVAGSALLAQLLLAAGTFASYYTPATELPATTASPLTFTAPAPAVQAAGQSAFWAAPFEVAQGYFEQHMPLLVTLWLLGLVAMALRLIGGVAYTQRLRHYKTAPLGAHWQQQVHALSQAIGIRKSIRLVESALVRVPMAIGFAKPVILLPIGAVTGLTQAQVEAVLAHELAHILRKDYLVNLLQSVVDMLFFYHPAMWWVSGVVRAERENCCDDMAVALCGDTLTYARALAEIEAMRLPAAPAMAVAFSGERGTLLSRIRRLVGQPSLKPTFTEGFAAALVLVVGLLVLSFGAVAGLKPQHEQDTLVPMREASPETDAATVPEENLAAAYTVQDSAGNTRDIVIIKNKKGKVKELYVDGKRIPKKHMDEYESLINQRLQAVAHAPKASRQEVANEIATARAALADAKRENRETYSFNFSFSDGDSQLVAPAPLPPLPPMPPMPPAPMPGLAPPAPPVPPVPPLSDSKEALKDYKQGLKEYEAAMKAFEEEMRAYQEEMKGFQEEMQEYQQELRQSGALNETQYRQQVEQRQAKAMERAARTQEMVRHQQERVQHQQEMALRQQEMAQQHQQMAKRHEEQFQKMKAELIKDGLIQKGDDNLNLRIDNGELYINDKKQPQPVYEKYKKLMNVEVGDSSKLNIRYKSN